MKHIVLKSIQFFRYILLPENPNFFCNNKNVSGFFNFNYFFKQATFKILFCNHETS